jgi:hypothetical protein
MLRAAFACRRAAAAARRPPALGRAARAATLATAPPRESPSAAPSALVAAAAALPPAAAAAVADATAPRPPPSAPTLLAPLIERSDSTQRIESHDRFGFRVNGVHLRGSVLVFPLFSLLWDCTSVDAITPRAIAAVHMLRPRPEILLLGTGREARNVNPAL